jgi:hypothetical protein
LKDVNKVIEAFKDVKFLGSKALDYADFCKAVNIINSKAHLTRVGLNKIHILSKGMNSKRTDFMSN